MSETVKQPESGTPARKKVIFSGIQPTGIKMCIRDSRRPAGSCPGHGPGAY